MYGVTFLLAALLSGLICNASAYNCYDYGLIGYGGQSYYAIGKSGGTCQTTGSGQCVECLGPNTAFAPTLLLAMCSNAGTVYNNLASKIPVNLCISGGFAVTLNPGDIYPALSSLSPISVSCSCLSKDLSNDASTLSSNVRIALILTIQMPFLWKRFLY